MPFVINYLGGVILGENSSFHVNKNTSSSLISKLNDYEVELQANNRSSFKEFVSLDIINDIPDATTLGSFRERLRKANVKDKLFGCL